MKRLILAMVLLLLAGCGGDERITQEQLDELQSSLDQLATEVADLKSDQSTEQPIDQPQNPISDEGVLDLNPVVPEKPGDKTATPNPLPPVAPLRLSGKIVYSSDGDIFVMNGDGTGRKNVEGHPALRDSNPVWSLSGEKIAFTNRFGLFVMSDKGTGLRRVFKWDAPQVTWENASRPIYRPAWSKSGVHLDVKGFPAVTPAWSPDFTKIACIDSGNNHRFLAVIDVATREMTGITKVRSARPAWSPDGKRIAYQVHSGINDEDPQEIYVINADGTGNMNISRNPEADDQFPTWSPDGRHIAFASFRAPDFNWEIYVMNADGSNQRNLTNNPLGDDIHPHWKE